MNVFTPSLSEKNINFQGFLDQMTTKFGPLFESRQIDEFDEQFPELVFDYPNKGEYTKSNILMKFGDKYQKIINTIHGINTKNPGASKPHQRGLIIESPHFDGVLYSAKNDFVEYFYFLVRILHGKAEIDTVKGFFDFNLGLNDAVDQAISVIKKKTFADLKIIKVIALGNKDVVNTTFCTPNAVKAMFGFRIEASSLDDYPGQIITSETFDQIDLKKVQVNPGNGMTDVIVKLDAEEFDEMLLQTELYRNITALTPASRIRILSAYCNQI